MCEMRVHETLNTFAVCAKRGRSTCETCLLGMWNMLALRVTCICVALCLSEPWVRCLMITLPVPCCPIPRVLFLTHHMTLDHTWYHYIIPNMHSNTHYISPIWVQTQALFEGSRDTDGIFVEVVTVDYCVVQLADSHSCLLSCAKVSFQKSPGVGWDHGGFGKTNPLRSGPETTVVPPHLWLYQFFLFLGAKQCHPTPRVADVEFDDVHQSSILLGFMQMILRSYLPLQDQGSKGFSVVVLLALYFWGLSS